ncbi:HGT1 [Symbiodinium sp. CCMP2592]|nr:HGT1 [Symbiodinium sp. CCMP2592]
MADCEESNVCCCTLFCCGEARIASAIIVDEGLWQTVVACPAECGITTAGCFWNGAERLACPEYEVQCEGEEQRSCRVVFYTVDPRSLVPVGRPGARLFRDGHGEVVFPSVPSVAQSFYGPAEMNALHVQTLRPGKEALGYYEVAIGAPRSFFTRNSLVLIPNFLSQLDCQLLWAAVDQRVALQPAAAKLASSESYASCREGLDRLPLSDLSSGAQGVSEQILVRLLGFFEALPSLAQQVFERTTGLAGLRFAFAAGEPAVNRYEVGGGFGPHKDEEMVTVNIVLSEPDAFSGGGTLFWPEEEAAEELVLLRPQQGVAVLFHGQLKHAGRAVTKGLRHLYVASFSLTEEGAEKRTPGKRREMAGKPCVF